MILTIEDLIIHHDNQTYKISITFGAGCVVILDEKNPDLNTKFLKAIAGVNAYKGKIVKSSFSSSAGLNQTNYLAKELAINLDEAVINNIDFWSNLAGSIQMISASVHYFGLQDLVDVECSKLNEEQLKRVALSRLLACYADLWLLDWPDKDLSKETIDRLINAIDIRAQERGIIILSPHQKMTIKSSINLDLRLFIDQV